MLLSNTVFADAQHVFTGGYSASVVQSLKYVLSGGDSSYQTNIMSAGVNQWNGISSKVAVSLNSTGAKMSIYKSTTTVNGLYGEMKPYKSDWTLASTTDIWHVTDVFIYDNQMTNDGATDAQKRATITHEVGHGLSMAHTNDLTTVEVMDQGLGKALSPSDIDKGHLRLKWGN